MPLESLLHGIRKAEEGLRTFGYISVLALATLGLSCSTNAPGIKGRIGCLPCPTPLTNYLGEDAAKHEGGIAFTHKYGHVDLAHIRIYAEWTDYLARTSLENLKNGNREFEFAGKEPVKYYVKIDYPSKWNEVEESRKQEVIETSAIELGAYLSSITSIWHETLTWFNWNSTFIIPEHASAFSWEDMPSDTFGCYVGKLALQDKTRDFKDAINIVLEQELDRLEIQPRSTNMKAIKSVEGSWYKGYGIGAKIIKRNLDIGEGDNEVSPCIPPDYLCEEQWNCPVPTLSYLKENGLNVEVNIRPVAKRNEMLNIAGKKGIINVGTDLPIIMKHMRREAIKKGYIVDD